MADRAVSVTLVDRLGVARRYAYLTALAAGLGYVVVGGLGAQVVGSSSPALRTALWVLLTVAGLALAVGVCCAVGRWFVVRGGDGPT